MNERNEFKGKRTQRYITCNYNTKNTNEFKLNSTIKLKISKYF